MADIKEWINEQLKAGFSKEKIEQALIKGGYDPKLLEEVMTENLINQGTNNTLMTKSNVSIALFIISFFAGVIVTLLISNMNYIDKADFLKYEDVLNRNPKLSLYTKGAQCRENAGFSHFNEDAVNSGKSRLAFLTFNNELIGVRLVWSASEGWLPYADQPEGAPIEIRGLPHYFQTVYFKAPPTAADCAAIAVQ